MVYYKSIITLNAVLANAPYYIVEKCIWVTYEIGIILSRKRKYPSVGRVRLTVLLLDGINVKLKPSTSSYASVDPSN